MGRLLPGRRVQWFNNRVWCSVFSFRVFDVCLVLVVAGSHGYASGGDAVSLYVRLRIQNSPTVGTFGCVVQTLTFCCVDSLVVTYQCSSCQLVFLLGLGMLPR